jgi:hypothetical protein
MQFVGWMGSDKALPNPRANHVIRKMECFSLSEINDKQQKNRPTYLKSLDHIAIR